jgi:hypothetical protein
MELRQPTECETVERGCRIDNRRDAVADCSTDIVPYSISEACKTLLVTSVQPIWKRVQRGEATDVDFLHHFQYDDALDVDVALR